MMKKKIIVPTDLTVAGDEAIRQAILIAPKNNSSLVLLHIMTEKDELAEDAVKMLHDTAVRIHAETGIDCEVLIKEGPVFDAISFIACEKDYDLMVIGTHGIRGFRQKLLGADIFKLVRRIPIPVLVIQKGYSSREFFKRMVLPVSSHVNFSSVVDATVAFARLFDAEVHLYSIIKAGFDWPDQILKNIDYATGQFGANGIKMVRIKEEQNVYSLGFAKQTINYSNSVDADAICIISPSSEEYYYFAPSDKETLLLNEYKIPILCAGGNL